jgi:two-component system chemotaxis response regulator CheY
MRILVVDDDEATRLCLSKVLESSGEITGVSNGVDALAAFGKALEEGRPFGVVCMDINMPRLNGQQALKAMRDMELKHKVPPGQEAKVVMVSACTDTANVVEAYFGGLADGFVSKPLRVASFKDELRKVGCRLP